ncbi:MAG: (Fe-S)-binding protein [Rhizobiales bacterium]|nr:(Fe-S)-binding protein [Hyphomicrobiales bacterium]
MTMSFEAALSAQVDSMLDACVRCGKCVEVCPVTDAGGVQAEPVEVIDGIIDLLRGGEGSDNARRWASSCVLTGACMSACDYGVNPRFLLAMARVNIARSSMTPQEQRKRGIENFRRVNREVTTLSRMQLEDDVLARLGQGSAAVEPDEAPDFIFYTGCNVLKTPHIALLCLDVMDTLDVSYRVMGGPSHCCGVVQSRTGDLETSGRMAQNSVAKLSQSKRGEVISWCPNCFVQFTETTLPAAEKIHGARPFEMTPFMRFLAERLDRLRPMLVHPVPMRVALHRHPGVPGVTKAAEAMLAAVPGITLVDLGQPGVGLQSSSLSALPELRREMQLRELEAAEAAGVDAIVAVYHTDHRELCAHERGWPFRILNVLEIVADSMGVGQHDRYKELKLMQEADRIIADCAPLIDRHRIDPATAHDVVVAMLKEQPVPLRR